jgi:putative membrane protein
MQSLIKQFLLRWLVNFFGLWAAATLLTGIGYQDKLRVLIWAALIFSLVNAVIRPLVLLLSLPAILLSLGLFTFVVNAFMLYVVTFFYPKFHIASFGSALLAVIIIGIVNFLLNDLLKPHHEKPV